MYKKCNVFVVIKVEKKPSDKNRTELLGAFLHSDCGFDPEKVVMKIIANCWLNREYKFIYINYLL